MAQLRYRAGFDFLRLRASVGEVDEAIPDWWQTFSTANDTLREDLIAQVREQMREQQRMRQRKPQREGDAPQTDDVGDVAGARKPRSRRRKPRTRGQAAHDSGMANPAAADDVQPSRAGRDAASGAADQPQADAPAKKPRRRRKPSSKTSGSGAEGGQPV